MATWKEVTDEFTSVRGTPKNLLAELRENSQNGVWIKHGYPVSYTANKEGEVLFVSTEDVKPGGGTCDALYMINIADMRQCVADLG